MQPSTQVGKTKTPERAVADIYTIHTFSNKPLYFEIEYKKEVKVDKGRIECLTLADCVLMVAKLKVLMRMGDRRGRENNNNIIIISGESLSSMTGEMGNSGGDSAKRIVRLLDLASVSLMVSTNNNINYLINNN
eukprot:Tbor_TRINITY_DN5130_c3_g1::TRINITY_DN5130_c3_g1_i6::g.25654::m.25654